MTDIFDRVLDFLWQHEFLFGLSVYLIVFIAGVFMITSPDPRVIFIGGVIIGGILVKGMILLFV